MVSLDLFTQLALGMPLPCKALAESLEVLQGFGALEVERKTCILKKGFVIAIAQGRRGLLSDLASHQVYKTRFHFLSSDLVLMQKKGGKVRVLGILHKARLKLCYLDKIKGRHVGILLENKQHLALKSRQKALSQLPRFCVLHVDVISGEIHEVLGVLEEERLDERILLSMRHLGGEFSQEALDFAKSFGDHVDKALYPHRADLTHLPFCSIDPSDAKDFDDAIFYDEKNRQLYVAIADVSEYVAPHTPLDLEARRRGFSIYFPHTCYPMLPASLSQNLCSLIPHQDRLAYVWKITLNRWCEIEHSELFEAVIKSCGALSYDWVDEWLERGGDGLPEAVGRSLQAFEKIAQKIRQKRAKNALMLENSEVKLLLDENLALKSVKIQPQSRSQKLIEEAMLLANRCAAQRLNSQMGIYRIHEEMDGLKKQQLFEQLESLGFELQGESPLQAIQHIQRQAGIKNCLSEIDTMIIRAQSRAAYAPLPSPHFGLGFACYTHFTSPIRRYSDLFLHRLLKAQAKTQEALRKHCPALCSYLNWQDKKIASLELDFMERKFARFAQRHLGLEIRAVVCSDEEEIARALEVINGARIVIEDAPVALKLMDRIRVRITRTKWLENEIFGEFVCYD